MIDFKQVDQLLRARRSVYPTMYTDEHISDDTIWEILENANWAPTHKMTEPWRFRVLRGQALVRLGEYLAQDYIDQTPGQYFSAIKLRRIRKKPTLTSAIILVSMQRDKLEQVPEWEELAAVSCAVQNIWLSCAARNIGCYWSTPGALVTRNSFLETEDGERCLGLLYLGYSKPHERERMRGPVAEKVIWFAE